MFSYSRLFQVASISASLCFSVSAFAFTGNQLQKAIQAGQQKDVQIYIAGVLDGFLVGSVDIGLTASLEAMKRGESLNGVALSQRGKYCLQFLNNKFDPDQIFGIFKKFLANSPERRHEQGATLILEATSKAFPCS